MPPSRVWNNSIRGENDFSSVVLLLLYSTIFLNPYFTLIRHLPKRQTFEKHLCSGYPKGNNLAVGVSYSPIDYKACSCRIDDLIIWGGLLCPWEETFTIKDKLAQFSTATVDVIKHFLGLWNMKIIFDTYIMGLSDWIICLYMWDLWSWDSEGDLFFYYMEYICMLLYY